MEILNAKALSLRREWKVLFSAGIHWRETTNFEVVEIVWLSHDFNESDELYFSKLWIVVGAR